MQRNAMKKIRISSKREFPSLVKKAEDSGEPWAYISVESTQDLVDAKLVTDNIHYLPSGPNVLNLNFDDIEEYTEHNWNGKTYKIYPISENQAKEILEFGETHKDYNLLIHCYAGRSRSVAVGLGLMDVFPETWELSKESNPILTPNMEVLRLIHKFGFYQ